MPNWDEIREEFETSKKTFRELAEEFNVKESTLKSRKQREGWTRASKDATRIFPTKKMQLDATGEEVINNGLLTERQKLFCLHYIKSFNGTMAAIKAGYAQGSAHVTAHQLINNPKIQTEIRRLKGNVHQELMVDAQDVINIQLKIAFADITDYVKFGKSEEVLIDEYTGEPLRYKNGTIKKHIRNYIDFEDWDKIDGTIVSEVKQGRDGISVKMADRSKAIEFLTRYFDMVPDEHKDKLLELKTEELNIRKQESESRHGEPDKPDISAYVEALRGNIKAVFDDEE